MEVRTPPQLTEGHTTLPACDLLPLKGLLYFICPLTLTVYR